MPIRRGRIVHRASTDMSMSDCSFDESRTIITRLVDDDRLQHLRGLGDVRAGRGPG